MTIRDADLANRRANQRGNCGARRSTRDFELDAGDVVFTVADLPNGSWRLRVIVDGAMSRPTMTAGVYSGPTLVVP